VPGLVGHLHLDDDVPGEELALDFPALAALHLDERLGRNADLAEMVGHPHRLDPLLQVLAHALLETRVGVDDVPVLGLRFRLCLGRHANTPTARKSLSMTQASPVSTTKR